MKVSITKKEYRLLLDVLSMADWVMNAFNDDERPEVEPYVKLEQKLLSLAKDFDCEDLVTYDKGLKRYFPTRRYEEQGRDMGFIEEFEEEFFWDELEQRLAERDLVKSRGMEAAAEMEPPQRITELDRLADGYREEFSKHGLERLVISKANGR